MGWEIPRRQIRGDRFDSEVESSLMFNSVSITLYVKTKLWDPWERDGATVVFDNQTRDMRLLPTGTAPQPHHTTSAPYTPAEKRDFARRFKEIIEGYLDNVFVLVPVRGTGAGPYLPIKLRIQLLYVSGRREAHFNAVIFKKHPHQRMLVSRVSEIGGVTGNRFPFDWDAMLDFDDLIQVNKGCNPITPADAQLMGLPGPVACPTSNNAPNQGQIAALHEFMHYIGFHHAGYLNPMIGPLVWGNATAPTIRPHQYGHPVAMPDARRDIMGAGNDLFHYHAVPWIRRLEEHGVLTESGTTFRGDSFYGNGVEYELLANHDTQSLPARPLGEIVTAYETGMRSCSVCTSYGSTDSRWMWDDPVLPGP